MAGLEVIGFIACMLAAFALLSFIAYLLEQFFAMRKEIGELYQLGTRRKRK
jgi:hypothetical protein